MGAKNMERVSPLRGGAGELTAIDLGVFKSELEKIEWIATGHCAGADTGSYTAKLWPWLTKQIINAALAAKAPQGVPDALSLAVAIANTLMSQNMLDVTVQQAMFPIKRVLEGALPAPVSDDTIHHGMVPPVAISKLADEVNSLEAVLSYVETLVLEHSPDCSYGATNGPHSDFCDCGLGGRRLKRIKIQQLLVALVKAHQGASSISKLADEVNQCLQIILINAGNLENGGLVSKERGAIEDAVDRAAKATWAALHSESAAPKSVPAREVKNG